MSVSNCLKPAVALPHEFVIELGHLVVTSHKLTLDAIDRDEKVEIGKLDSDMSQEDPDTLRSIERDIETFYDDMRRATNNLAAVALVTRVQHRVSRLAKKVPGKPEVAESKLVSELDHLNGYLGDGPVPVAFFAELEKVRDSIIHADSNAEWDYRGAPRRVANCYKNAYDETNFSEAQLNDAVAKAIEQVTWYDEKLSSMRTSAATSKPLAEC
jgi:hypothetical protein